MPVKIIPKPWFECNLIAEKYAKNIKMKAVTFEKSKK